MTHMFKYILAFDRHNRKRECCISQILFGINLSSTLFGTPILKIKSQFGKHSQSIKTHLHRIERAARFTIAP